MTGFVVGQAVAGNSHDPETAYRELRGGRRLRLQAVVECMGRASCPTVDPIAETESLGEFAR